MPLDPYRLDSNCSLNRLRIIDLPDYALPDDIKGKSGFDLLASVVVKGLTPQEHGRRIAYLLLTLKRGDAINRAARPQWDDSYWDYWSQIDTFWIGGGQVSGAHGAAICVTAEQTMQQAGFPAIRVRCADHPRLLPVMGAARYLPPEIKATAAVVLDFGGTAVKRACALYTGEQLERLHVFPSSPVFCEAQLPSHVETMLSCITETVADAQRSVYSPADTVMISLASYTPDGQPVRGVGCYDRLRDLADDVRGYLSDRLSQRLDRALTVQLIHDGTAAAAAYAGTPNSAVIMLGTAIGYGFPPPEDRVRGVAANVAILGQAHG